MWALAQQCGQGAGTAQVVVGSFEVLVYTVQLENLT